jgi:hypothetical protein
LLIDEQSHGLTGLVLDLDHVGFAFGCFGDRDVSRLQIGAAGKRKQVAIEFVAEPSQPCLFDLFGVELLPWRTLANDHLHAATHAAAVLHVVPRRVAGKHGGPLDRDTAHHLRVLEPMHPIRQLHCQNRGALDLALSHLAREWPFETKRLERRKLVAAKCLPDLRQDFSPLLRRILRGNGRRTRDDERRGDQTLHFLLLVK